MSNSERVAACTAALFDKEEKKTAKNAEKDPAFHRYVNFCIVNCKNSIKKYKNSY